jgi:O-antigen/teichoic acid export membrane protein
VKLTELITKMMGFVGARIAGAMLGFLSQLMLARLLPVADVGVVIMGMSAASFISIGANGGYSVLATSELPKLEERRMPAAFAAFNRIASMDGIVTYLFLCVLGLLAAALFNLSNAQKTVMLMGFLCAPASSAIRYHSSLAVAVRYYKTSYMPDLMFRPAAFLIALLAASLAGFLHSAIAALSIFTFVTYMAVVGQVWALKSHRLSWKTLGWPRKFFARHLRSRALALTLVSATMLAFADVVITVAGFILPERDVAIAGVAMRIAAIAGFVLQAGQTMVMTDFTQAYVRGDDVVVNAMLKRVNGLTVGVVLASLLGVVLFGKFALGLFGEAYQQGAYLLVLFMIGQSIRAFGGMNQQILSINGFQIRTAWSCLWALIIFVCLAVLMCRNFGATGLGYAVIITEIIWLLALASQVANLCGRRGDLFWVLQKR